MIKAKLLEKIRYNDFIDGNVGDSVYILLQGEGVDWDSNKFYVIYSDEHQESCTVDSPYVNIIDEKIELEDVIINKF